MASTNILGAIGPETATTASLVRPQCNIGVMGLHRAEIAARVTPGWYYALFFDQAGRHIPVRLVVPGNITIVPLPAKCSELNLVETIWPFVRNDGLSNWVFGSYEAIVDPCFDA